MRLASLARVGTLVAVTLLAACHDTPAPTAPTAPPAVTPQRTPDALTDWTLGVDSTEARLVSATDSRLVGTWAISERLFDLYQTGHARTDSVMRRMRLTITPRGAWQLTVDSATVAEGPVLIMRSGHVVLHDSEWNSDGWIDLYSVVRLDDRHLVIGAAHRRHAMEYQRLSATSDTR